MKRIIAAFALMAFVFAAAGAVVADDRTAEEKLEAGRAYLKTLDEKIIRFRNQGNQEMVTKLRAEKVSTIARMQVWKAEAEAVAIAPPPPPPQASPVAPTLPPPPRPMPRRVEPTGLFGMGIETAASLGYIAGNSVISARGDLVLGDALGLGSMLGLSEDAVAWNVGLGYAQGEDINGNAKKVIPLYFDGVLNIPAEMMGGMESYVKGGVNYVVYGTEQKAGSYGVQACYGIQGDIGLGGQSFVELGYAILRSGADGGHSLPYSMKGVGVNFGTRILL